MTTIVLYVDTVPVEGETKEGRKQHTKEPEVVESFRVPSKFRAIVGVRAPGLSDGDWRLYTGSVLHDEEITAEKEALDVLAAGLGKVFK